MGIHNAPTQQGLPGLHLSHTCALTEVEHICLKDLTLLCQDHVDLPKHSFKTGMKLEMVSPWEQLQICPVSVTKVSHAETMSYLKIYMLHRGT